MSNIVNIIIKKDIFVLSKVFMAIKWIYMPGYFQGVVWIVLVSLISNSNDILMRLLGNRLASEEIAFFRFFLSMLTVLPFMLYYGKTKFITSRPGLHIIRALLGFVAIALWCYGIGKAPLVVVSTMALTVPLFVLPFSRWFLKEKIGWQRLVATVVGFIGILIIVIPGNDFTNIISNRISYGVSILLLAAILFALSDVLNKRMIKQENVLSMLFYFSLGTSVVGFFPLLSVWMMPTGKEFVLLFLLGIGANLILYCLLRAFSAIEISALTPYRYLELIFATCFGYLLFSEFPRINTIIGALVIVVCTFFIAYYETKIKREIANE